MRSVKRTIKQVSQSNIKGNEDRKMEQMTRNLYEEVICLDRVAEEPGKFTTD